MAIQQVSRITVRKGLEEDLPQPLAGAELGWALDQRRLYIGNGELAEGAPVIGNTEILTEFSDLFEYSSAYTYRGDAAGYTVQTGPTSGDPVSQSLQSRLDSYAIVTDFGARGDGVTDDTAAINRALFELYCRENNTQTRRSLFFPAGDYLVSNTILIPPFARLYGEGTQASRIRFAVQPWAPNTAYGQAGILVEQGGTYYRSRIPVPATGIPITNVTYWDVTTLPTYVVRTADSQQQTGANIGVNGASPPRAISITNMQFQTDVAVSGSHDIMLLDRAEVLSFQDVTWSGPLTTATLTTATNDLAAVRVSSTNTLPCANIVFERCVFTGLTYGFYVTQPNYTKGINVNNSRFEVLYQGAVLQGDDDNTATDNPTGWRFVANTFDDIYAEGVIINGCFLNGTAYNSFLGVGNRFNTTPVSEASSSACMIISADNNVSVGDLFARTDQQAALTNPRIRLFNVTAPQRIPTSIAVTNGRLLQLGSYARQSGIQQDVEDGQSVEIVSIDPALGLDQGNPRAFAIDYTMIRLTSTSRAIRTGRLTVISPQDGDSAGEEDIVWTDDYSENTQTDMQFVITATPGGSTTVDVTAAATGFDGVIYYSLNYQA